MMKQEKGTQPNPNVPLEKTSVPKPQEKEPEKTMEQKLDEILQMKNEKKKGKRSKKKLEAENEDNIPLQEQDKKQSLVQQVNEGNPKKTETIKDLGKEKAKEIVKEKEPVKEKEKENVKEETVDPFELALRSQPKRKKGKKKQESVQDTEVPTESTPQIPVESKLVIQTQPSVQVEHKTISPQKKLNKDSVDEQDVVEVNQVSTEKESKKIVQNKKQKNKQKKNSDTVETETKVQEQVRFKHPK